ncbi:Plant intracellular Ras-group-related LRR protein 5 [Nymphaea thermarum]|nr:Plant intracellular Ras-group-related LRR protein 5 [Nymphaea thermarum]
MLARLRAVVPPKEAHPEVSSISLTDLLPPSCFLGEGLSCVGEINTCSDEAKLKRAVIERVLTRLNKTPFEVAKHPVGDIRVFSARISRRTTAAAIYIPQAKDCIEMRRVSRGQRQEKAPGPETIDAEGIQILSYFNDCTVSAECFENMPNLRYVRAEHVNFQGTFPCFPTDLKWLQLRSCHFDSPPSEFNLEKLVILDLYETNMAPILRLKAFERLKVLSIDGVKTKITLDFMNMRSLVTLRFLYCSALTTIDESIGELKNLAHLSTSGCRLLRKLPDSIWQLSSLEVLNISRCWEFSSLPERLGELGSLKKLDLSFTRIERLPDSICQLSSLEMLVLPGTELRSIPEGLGDMESLKKIDLSRTCIEVIPDSIGQLTDLKKLFLCDSGKLRELPESICQLKLLKSLDLTGCLSLCSLPERLGDMEKLEELILDSTRIEAIPDSVGRLDNLRLLSLKGCKFIKALPISIRQLSFLQRLEMFGTNLNVGEGMLAASIGQTDFARLSSLESLDLTDCKELEYLPQLPSSLHSLRGRLVDWKSTVAVEKKFKF